MAGQLTLHLLINTVGTVASTGRSKEYISIKNKKQLPFVFVPEVLPQKAGTRITAPPIGIIGNYLWSQKVFCKVYRVGWVDFELFSNFMYLHVVWGTPRYNTGNCQISLTLVKKTNESIKRYHFKGQN